MFSHSARCAWLFVITTVFALLSTFSFGQTRGIYITQSTLENTAFLTHLIHQAKAVGINTFVVDLEIPSKRYAQNIKLVTDNDIDYVARVVVFPDGGRADQIASQPYWEKRFGLIKQAIAYGADQIQLDYIRYNVKQKASPENAKNILKVVQWFKEKVGAYKIPLQADVFGIASFGESPHIGQNLKMMATAVDALCPMVYPSHFDPYIQHAKDPYGTIFKSLKAIHAQFNGKMPVKLIAYIELSNYRYPLTGAKRTAYIKAQISAVKDAGADGWYAWSAHNKYDYLFDLMRADGGSPKIVEAKN